MKVVILAGGKGSRISELTRKIPKPMIKIKGIPMLLHIINIYLSQGFNQFYIATGYKSSVIKNYFKKFKIKKNYYNIFDKKKVGIIFINTGLSTMTGGRLKRLKEYLKNESFMLTYGDGMANVNLKRLQKFHLNRKRVGTVTAVRPLSKYGILDISKNLALSFKEKKQLNVGWINGGYFVFNYKIFNYLKNDKTVLEKMPLETLAKKRQLNAYKHDGFWQCVDTKRDKDYLENSINTNKLPWEKIK